MSKFVASLFAAVCFVGLASTAKAGPISGCVEINNGANLAYDLYETDANRDPSEYSKVVNGFGDWLTGVTFILDAGGTYDGTPQSVSDIVVIHADGAELFSFGYAGDPGAGISSVLRRLR